ncbi:hypothetical protein Tco_0422844, partial [Tanacetum coccineum]
MTEDNNISSKIKRNRASWKPISVVKTFLEACLHKLAFDEREDSDLKGLSWKRVAKVLKDNHNFEADQKHMKNHYDYLINYTTWFNVKRHGPCSTEPRRVVEPHMVEDDEHIEVVNVESPTPLCPSHVPRLCVKTKKETTVGRTVPLLSVAPEHAESELKAIIDKLFDEGGSGNQAEQEDSAGVGEGTNIEPVIEATDTVAENVAPLQPRCQRKRKSMVVDVGEASHPPKKLREDHGTPSEASVGGKSRSTIQRLLFGAVLNAEVRGEPIPTLPFVTSSVSATPGREGGDHTDFVSGPNLRTIGASQRFVICSDSSHHSGTNVAEAEVDSLI